MNTEKNSAYIKKDMTLLLLARVCQVHLPHGIPGAACTQQRADNVGTAHKDPTSGCGDTFWGTPSTMGALAQGQKQQEAHKAVAAIFPAEGNPVRWCEREGCVCVRIFLFTYVILSPQYPL